MFVDINRSSVGGGIMKKYASRKNEIPEETPRLLSPEVSPAPTVPEVKTPYRGFIFYSRLVFVLVIIWVAGKEWIKTQPNFKLPTLFPKTQKANAIKPTLDNGTVNNSTENSVVKSTINTSADSTVSSAPKKTEPITTRMNATFEFSGVKTKWGYSSWVQNGNPNLNKSIAGSNLQVRQVQYKRGIGVHAPSKIVFNLKGKVKRFSCLVAPDDSGGNSDNVVFQVFGDGHKLFESPALTVVSAPSPVDLDVSGILELSLEVDPSIKGAGWGHADWINIKFTKAKNAEEEEAAEE
jgi:hypothetical protein